MAQGTHTGKIVVTIEEQTPVRPRSTAVPRDWSTGTCLITGGTGGLGLSIAHWLADQGCASIALVGRREESDAVAAALRPLRERGVTVRVLSADIATAGEVRRVIADIDARMAPLTGVVHAAGILDDATIAKADSAQMARVFAPKATGAWHLHHETLGRRLDFFVLFSSVSAFVGSAGQAAYASANAWLDSLAAHRRALGLPGISINWGPWSDVGLAAARTDRGARLAERGLGSLTPAVGVDAFARIMRENPVQATAMTFDVARWVESMPSTAGSTLFKDLLLESADRSRTEPASHADGLRDLLEQTPAGRRRRTVFETFLQQTVAQVLKLAPSRVDVTKPLRTMGLDSLMGLELRNRLETATGLSIPATLVWNHPTVSQLAAELASRMQISLDATAPVDGNDSPSSVDIPGTDLNTLLAEVEGLSDEDARRLLAEKR
jgi:NAD(P)-dependent dehydrogenase (short-subunit alcohol dehydrogenase family)/acyl carrier protein